MGGNAYPRDYNAALSEGVPVRTVDALRRYIDDKIQPGGFLLAVLANDLSGAFARADDGNTQALRAITGWVYNHAPSACWGDSDAVRNWLEDDDERHA